MDYEKEEINIQDRLRLLIDSLLISHYGEGRAEQITIDFLANLRRSHQLDVLSIALNGPEEIDHNKYVRATLGAKKWYRSIDAGVG